MLSSESPEKSGNSNPTSNMWSPYPNYQQHSFECLNGHVAILWDIENCPIPSDVRPEDVAGNIRMALDLHPIINGAVRMFSAYGDFNAFPRRLREGCQRTGVKLIDVPNGRKDAADKAILVDMFLFAFDNPPPSSIMLISGDVDFAHALHILGQRGYTVILVIPSQVNVSSALRNAGRFVWDWQSVVRGDCFLPLKKGLHPHRGGTTGISAALMGPSVNPNSEGFQNEEEGIVYRGISESYCSARDMSMISQTPAEYGCTSTSAGNISSNHCQNDLAWVQPGDLNGLKAQLVNLLELRGGCLPFKRLSSEYQRLYSRPLYVSEYGAFKLINLLKNFGDALAVEGNGPKKIVYLRNTRAGPTSSPPLTQTKSDKKGKGVVPVENTKSMIVVSDEFSDDEQVIVEEHRGRTEKSYLETGTLSEFSNKSLEKFKQELQEIFVSYSCWIFMGHFEEIYQQRYKRPLDYKSLGVNELGELLDRVKDVVVVYEELVSGRKFLTAVGG
ncbi:unnamed protein product [Cuscuta campestris]|uniref:HTH OST-type domain-containing protein n=1 Tax=Cuscuta campestris TaxID=132261 RepID=A0A484L7E0_9ASTE|nr:unnamed protein product [Cuscuta campestris]